MVLKATKFTRPLAPGEEPAAEAVLRAAFGGAEEATLVRALRRQRDMAGEMVVAADNAIIGYYALSWMRAPKGWLCLAPVAVHPDWQRLGHGRRMVAQLAEWARLSGTYVVVLGDPAIYGRAGFSSDRAARLQSAYPVEHLLLAGPGQDAPAVTLRYPAAFDASG